MATKWRAQQRRKRWTERALSLPASADKNLEALSSAEDAEVAAFGNSLKEFVQLPTTFAQIAAAKRLSEKLLALATGLVKEQALKRALKLYVELLFGENSRPLHKGLLIVFLHHFPAEKAAFVKEAFLQGCVEYGAEGINERRFSVAGLATSLANSPQKSSLIREVTEHCLRVIALTLCHDVRSILAHCKQGGRPTPKTMEECQDCMSALYYLLQNFPHCFRCFKEIPACSPSGGEVASSGIDSGIHERRNESGEVYLAAVEIILSVLQSTALSRDCVVGAGVALCAASHISMSAQCLAWMFANAAFPSTISQFALLSEGHGLLCQGQQGMLELAIHELRGTNLAAEIAQFTEFGKLCLFRGLLTGVPRSALNSYLLSIPYQATKATDLLANVTRSESSMGGEVWETWTLLYNGILPALCKLCEGTMDSHFKFHTVTAMQICLQQIKASVVGRMTDLAAAEFSHAALKHHVTIQTYNPLPTSMVDEVLKVVWNNWEDPLTQTVKQVQVVFDLLIDVQSVYLPLKSNLELEGDKARMVAQTYSSDLRFDEQACNATELESHLDLGSSAQFFLDDLGFSQKSADCKDGEAKDGTQKFLIDIATDLLSVGGHRKGRYVPLASLTLRIGALKLLEISPNLIFETVFALQDDDVCCSASCFLKSFLERLREEHWTLKGVTKGSSDFRRLWIPPILAGLASVHPRLRSNLNTYALPVALEIDPDSVLPMLDLVLERAGAKSRAIAYDFGSDAAGLDVEADKLGAVTMEQSVATLISILKVARSLSLIEGQIVQKSVSLHHPTCSEAETESEGLVSSPSSAVFRVRGHLVSVTMSFLKSAVSHLEDGVRVDVAELLCLSPKTASMPSQLELQLLHLAVPLNMRCSSTGFRMKWISLLKKFFLRVRTAVERQQKLDYDQSKVSLKNGKPTADPIRACPSAMKVQALVDADAYCTDLSNGVTVENMQHFMQWLTQVVLASLYPSAPYERKSTAMEIFNALLDVWSLSEPPAQRSGRFTSSPYVRNDFSPYKEALLSPETTFVVFASVVDSWDRLREGSFRVLTRYPTPLPGLDTESSVEVVLAWVKGLVRSPRVRESDAGALALRLIFKKYVCELGWIVKLHPDPQVVKPENVSAEAMPELLIHKSGDATGMYMESLNDWLEFVIGEGDANLIKACEQSFVHGVLLALRYTVEELDFSSRAVQASSVTIRNALDRLLGLLLRVTTLALWVVSADALNVQERFSFNSVDELRNSEIRIDDEKVVSHEDGDIEDCTETEGLAPVEQMVMVGCWLSMKEVSLLLGSIAGRVPLPGSTFEDTEGCLHQQGSTWQACSQLDNSSGGGIMLDTRQLESIGQHFLQVLLSMKHNGAIDKTRTGFTALCDRLLRSNDSRLNAMPEVWLEQLIQHTGAKGQTVDDLLRRSAGIPAAFLALFLSEPDGAPKKLLPAAMKWIMKTASDFVSEPSKTREFDLVPENGDNMASAVKVDNSSAETNISLSTGMFPKALKHRDEGVVPAVHSFNVMRVAFHDTNLATDTSGFCAEGLVATIQAFSSRHWEVRNSATLAFTALVHRTIGFLNVYKRESARRAITGFEFFHRYPALHPFLLQELKSATWQLEHGPMSEANGGIRLATRLHPSLGPVLLILSRLKPSLISSNSEDWLSLAAFMPYIMRCATQCNQHVRVLASRALAPLVPTEQLLDVLEGLANRLPIMPVCQPLDESGSAFAHRTFSYNAVHGVLLQIYVLLSSNCASLRDLDSRLRIVNRVAMIVEQHMWLGSVKHCSCHMVVRGFLQMLDGLLTVSRSCRNGCSGLYPVFNRLDASLLHLCADCLSHDEDVTQGFEDSSRVILLETAAHMYFSSGLSKWSPIQGLDHDMFDAGLSATGKIISAISYQQQLLQPTFSMLEVQLRRALCDNMYEVRFATLKVLRTFFKTVLIDSGRSEACIRVSPSYTRLLQPLLKERLDVETHPGCICLILGVFYYWSEVAVRKESHGTILATSIWGQGHSVLTLLGQLFKVYETSRQSKTREVALRCVGGCLRHIVLQVRLDFKTMSTYSIELTYALATSRKMDGEEHDHNGFSCEVSSATKQDDITGSVFCPKIRTSIDIFVRFLGKHSQASEGVRFRRATAEAIVASRLLEEVHWVAFSLQTLQSQKADLEWYANSIMHVWSIAVKLLEDEDQELRHKLSQDVMHIVASPGNQGGPSDRSSFAIPSQVERVVQLSFDFLSGHFGFWEVYWDYLAQMILGGNNTGRKSDGVDLVRRLFDKELDNHHEEELCFVQLSCLHLNKLLHKYGTGVEAFHISSARTFLHWQMSNEESGQRLSALSKPLRVSTPLLTSETANPGDVSGPAETQRRKSWVHHWRRAFMMQSLNHVKASLQVQSSMHWLGGVTNHQDAFKPLYRSLLGLLTVAGPSMVPEDGLVAGLLDLTSLLKQLPLNPLISNTYLRLLTVYQKYSRTDVGVSDFKVFVGSAFLEEFEHLFLI